MSGARFALGRVTATPEALAALRRNNQAGQDFLHRHARGDWGEVSAHDRAANEDALIHGLRLLSAYRLRDGTKLWVITEADRSVTTLLLPHEY